MRCKVSSKYRKIREVLGELFIPLVLVSDVLRLAGELLDCESRREAGESDDILLVRVVVVVAVVVLRCVADGDGDRLDVSLPNSNTVGGIDAIAMVAAATRLA